MFTPELPYCIQPIRAFDVQRQVDCLIPAAIDDGHRDLRAISTERGRNIKMLKRCDLLIRQVCAMPGDLRYGPVIQRKLRAVQFVPDNRLWHNL
jgi:hypothetical protein